MSAPHDRGSDPARENSLGAAVRDIVAGTVLLALGLVTGGTSLLGRGDGVDLAFDGLGAVWIAWGVWRLVRSLRARRPSGPSPGAGLRDPDRSGR